MPLFLDQGENTPGKTTAEIQSVKIQVKSGEIPVRKNVGKIMQSVDSFRLRSKSAKLSYNQNSIVIKRFEHMKKQV